MLQPGDEAPPFTLPGAADGDVESVSLSAYVGEAVVVLAFYPGDFNPHVRADEWLADLGVLDVDRNVAVLGIAPDTAFSHRAFADEHAIGFPLLADLGGEVAAAYGVRQDGYEGHDGVPRRAVFVLDDRGVVRFAWAADGPDDAVDVGTVGDAIDGLKSDESAVQRYRVGHDYYRYGREEFDIATGAYEAGDWRLAAEAFGEAEGYMAAASEEFDSAHWFAASEDLFDTLRGAKERTDHYLRAARWYRDSARRYTDGGDEVATELRADAEGQHQRAHDGAPLPDPEELAARFD